MNVATRRARAVVASVACAPLDARALAALGACTLVALLANWRLLRPDFVSADALVHQYWMWQFRDPALFNDALTAELRHSARYPEGYELLFRLASQVVSPIASASSSASP